MTIELKTNTATRITVGPFLDKTDGITPEVALTATNEKLTLMVDTGGVPTIVLDANATASAGDNDMVHVTGDDAGYYDLELTAAQLNYVGNAKLSINYATDHLPVFHEIAIVSAQYWDAKYGTGNFSADLKAITAGVDFSATMKTSIETACDATVGGGTGTALTAIPWNAAWDAEVESEVDDALGGGTGTALTAIPWNAAWDAEVQSEVDDALVVQRLDELLNADSDIDGLTPPTVGSVFHELLTKTAGSFTFDQTTDSLEAIRDTAPLGTAMRGTDNAALASVCTEARLAELDAANLITDVANVKTDTAAILIDTAVIGAAGAGLTDLGGMSTTMKAQVQTEVEDGLVTHRLDELLNADSDIDGITPPTVGSVFHELLTKTAGSFTFDQSTDSLEAIRDTAPLGTAMRGTDNAALASVCTEARLAELDAANLITDVANVKTDTAAILVDTGTDGVALAVGAIGATQIASNALAAGNFASGTLAIRKNEALSNFTFLMVDSTDHVTPKTGLTITAQRSIDGAAFAACANAAAEVSNGIYKINLAATDLNGDTITLLFTSAGADATLITIVTQA